MAIYLDYASTSPILPEVSEIIIDCIKYNWYNPSGLYYGSKQSHDLLNNARECIAKKINANKEEIIFTSSGSESNNLAIKGFLKCHRDYFFLCDPLCHSSVKNMNTLCYPLTVDNYGVIQEKPLIEVCEILKENNKKPFVHIVGANNEIGTIQDVKGISEIIHRYNGVIHVDAVQLFSNQYIDVEKLKIDLMSISGHKVGTPCGIACLYIKNNITISPIISGEQENGIRGGTENLPYIMGFKKAVEMLDYDTNKKITELRDYFIDKILTLSNTKLIGAKNCRLSNNINICFSGIDSQALVYYLDVHDICCSTGSACNSFKYEPSHVLKAIGLDDKEALSCIRFTLGRNTTIKELDEVFINICNFIKIYNK